MKRLLLAVSVVIVALASVASAQAPPAPAAWKGPRTADGHPDLQGTWTTQTFAANIHANAIRWGTLYNFRFDADVPPQNGSITLGMFKTGSPASVNVAAQVPGPSKKGKCQADIVRIAVESRAFAKHFVGREYERLVHAKPDATEWGSATSEFAKDPGAYAAIVSRWLASDAYSARVDTPIPLGNRLFVRSLFVDLLGRVPTEEESEPMRQALDGLSDPVPLRSVLNPLFLARMVW